MDGPTFEALKRIMDAIPRSADPKELLDDLETLGTDDPRREFRPVR